MNISDFYIDVLNSFQKNDVEYMVVGGHAVNFHGHIRATLDMDLWVDTNDSNLMKLNKAFLDLEYNEESITSALAHLKNEHMIKIPKDNALIDILDSFMIKSDFSDCYKNCEIAEIDGVHIKVIGFKDLIECKYKSNRPKDLLDVKNLQELRKIRDNKQNIINDILKPKKEKDKNQGKDFGMSM